MSEPKEPVYDPALRGYVRELSPLEVEVQELVLRCFGAGGACILHPAALVNEIAQLVERKVADDRGRAARTAEAAEPWIGEAWAAEIAKAIREGQPA